MMLAHRQWADAHAAILAALGDGRRWVAVVGPSGVGKTMLLRDIARTLASESGKEIRNATQTAKHPMLVVATGANGTALLDDADGLSESLLAGLSAADGPRCVFAGSPDLAGRLRRIVRETRIVALDTLPPLEARAYLSLWLEREQLSPKFFEPEAAAELIAAAEGTPRTLSKLAHRAAQIAASEDARRVGPHHVREAISPPEVIPPSPPDTSPDRTQSVGRKVPARRIAAVALALAACLGALVVLYHAVGSVEGAARQTMAMLHAVAAPARLAPAPAPAPESLAAPRAVAAPQPPAAPPASAPLASAVRVPATVLLPSPVAAPPPASPPAPALPGSAALPAPAAPQPSKVALVALLPRSSSPASDAARLGPRASLAAASAIRPTLWDSTNAHLPRPAPAAQSLGAAFPVPDLPSTRTAAAEPPAASVPGLLLIVRGGETLGDMYARVYRGVVPPPFEDVAAANPKHFRPGDVLTFPPPPGGWKKPHTASVALP